jgi:hypothetical protein
MDGVLDVNVTRDFWDWILFAFTIATAFGTVGAVFVALFGQQWHQWRNQPSLTVLVGEGRSASFSDLSVSVRVTNAQGRDTAETVEAFVTISWVGGIAYVADDQLPIGARAETARTEPSSIPSGFARRVWLVRVVPPKRLEPRQAHHDAGDEEEEDELHLPTVEFFGGGGFTADAEFIVKLIVTGSNFDAIAFLGKFRVGAVDKGEGHMTTFWWTEAPKQIKDVIGLSDFDPTRT